MKNKKNKKEMDSSDKIWYIKMGLIFLSWAVMMVMITNVLPSIFL